MMENQPTAKRSRSRPTSIQDDLLVATESTRGPKATNEDRACSTRIDRVGMCYGVYDGHGGTEAADFTTANLIRNIAQRLRRLNPSLNEAHAAAERSTAVSYTHLTLPTILLV